VNVRGYAILTAPKTSVSLPYKLVGLLMGRVERETDITASGYVWDGNEQKGGGAVGLFGFCTGSAQRS